VKKKFHAVKKKRGAKPTAPVADDAIEIPDAPVIVSKKKRALIDVPTNELKVVIADTLERLGMAGGDHGRVNAEEYWAHNCVMGLKYGTKEDGRCAQSQPDIPIREHEYEKIPYCKEHK